jgi:hypothetical protein
MSYRYDSRRRLSRERKLSGASLSDGEFVLLDTCLWNITHGKMVSARAVLTPWQRHDEI